MLNALLPPSSSVDTFDTASWPTLATVIVYVTWLPATALAGPLQYVLQGLPAGVTLDNKSGDFNGAPYVTVPGASLAPGATVSVALTFTNPSKTTITYTSKLYSGTF